MNNNNIYVTSPAAKVFSMVPSVACLIKGLTTQEIAAVIGLIFLDKDEPNIIYEEFSGCLSKFIDMGYGKYE